MSTESRPIHICTSADRMVSLTVRMPYAWLLLPPACKVETRTWHTPYRGWVLFVVSQQSFPLWQQVHLSGDQLTRMDQYLPVDRHQMDRLQGHAIGIGYLSECRRMTRDDEDRCFVTYNPRLWCHVYDSVRAIEPFPYTGHLLYKNVDVYDRQRIKLI